MSRTLELELKKCMETLRVQYFNLLHVFVCMWVDVHSTLILNFESEQNYLQIKKKTCYLLHASFVSSFEYGQVYVTI